MVQAVSQPVRVQVHGPCGQPALLCKGTLALSCESQEGGSAKRAGSTRGLFLSFPFQVSAQCLSVRLLSAFSPNHGSKSHRVSLLYLTPDLPSWHLPFVVESALSES